MSITSANAIFTLQIPGLFDVPQILQNFSADEIFDVDPVEVKEVMMGVDGKLAAGFVFNPVRQGITLMANSASGDIFDAWNNTEKAIRDVLEAFATVTLPSIGLKWALSVGVLTTFPPIPNAAKTLRPRKFFITWEDVSPSLV